MYGMMWVILHGNLNNLSYKPSFGYLRHVDNVQYE